MLKLPFYLCEGRRCAQASLKSVLEYRRVPFDNSLLDRLIGAESQNPVTLIQVASFLIGQNVEFYYPVRNNFQDFTQESLKESIKLRYPVQLVSMFNLDAITRSYNNVLSSGRYSLSEKRPSIEDLRSWIDSGRIPICLINFDKLVRRPDKKNGHYITLVGIGERFVYFNNPGPVNGGVGKRLDFSRFNSCWDLGLFDWDVLVA